MHLSKPALLAVAKTNLQTQHVVHNVNVKNPALSVHATDVIFCSVVLAKFSSGAHLRYGNFSRAYFLMIFNSW